MATIRILYSCGPCGIERAPVSIEERGVTEDVVAWMDKVKTGLALDHQMRSPGCPSRVMREVMIPVPAGTARIGEVPRS